MYPITPSLFIPLANRLPIRPNAVIKAVNAASPAQKTAGTFAERLKQGVQKQVKDEPLLFWIGLMGVPAAILTPVTTYQDLKRRPVIGEQERHLLVTQEVLRQVISALTYFISYYGGIVLVGLQLKENTKYRSLKQLLGATVLTTIANGVIRPLITNAFLAKHAQHQQNKQPFPSLAISSFRNSPISNKAGSVPFINY